MKVLAIDTSNHPMSVALVEDEQLLATTTLNMVRNHSIYLMPTIDNLFKLVQWPPADLDRVVVARDLVRIREFGLPRRLLRHWRTR